MFKEEVQATGNAAKNKVALLKNKPLAYFFMSMIAGAYIGIGILLANTAGGLLNGNPATRIITGALFGVALSLVVAAGGELFTGNNMVMGVGVMTKSITLLDAVKLWVVCWIGNLAGSVLLACIYSLTGLGTGDVGAFMAQASATKMAVPVVALFMRGVLCNFLVCVAVWCSIKMKSETAKLLMVFWCLIAFVTTGFEHSIANMTLLTIGLINPMGEAISIGGYVYNLVVVTLGNMVGGILFVAVPYVMAAKEK